jgi:hypothetical protein
MNAVDPNEEDDEPVQNTTANATLNCTCPDEPPSNTLSPMGANG